MPSWHSLTKLINYESEPIKLNRTGLLSAPEKLSILSTASENFKNGNYAQDLTDLSALVSEMEQTEDGDLSVSRAVLAQCMINRYMELEDEQDKRSALELTRAMYEDVSLPQHDRARERARCAYEIGRRIDDTLLLEEGARFYDEAKSTAPFGMSEYRKLRRFAQECLDVNTRIIQGRIAIAAGTQESTDIVVHFPIESASVDANCWRGRSPRKRSAIPFATDIFGHPAIVLFSRTPPKEIITPEPERDTRGRLRLGSINRIEFIDASQVHRMAVSFRVAGNRDHARAALSEVAKELHGWGERVNRWIDVIGSGLPGNHASYLTRYIYANIGNEQLTPINADEPGMTRLMTVRPPTRLSRYDLSFVLSRLAHHEVPLCVEMLRMAQHSLNNDDARNAVVEAGTAAESALSLQFDRFVGPEHREARWTLGSLVQEISGTQGALPRGETQASLERNLVKPRNDAVHRATVTRKSAVDALDACERVVDHVIGLSLGLERLDERLQLLSPWLTAHEPLKGGY